MEHKIASVEKGTYALLINLGKEVSIAVGKLGLVTFPSGYYIYLGSAGGGLLQRVKRHLRGGKRLRWHIDYLLEFAQVVEVWYALSQEAQECLWCQIAQQMPQGKILFPGFGSSDCRCSSHLVYFPSPPSFELFGHRLKGNGLMVTKASAEDFLG